MKRRIVAVLALAAVAVPAAAAPAQEPVAVRTERIEVPVGDGTILRGTLRMPAGDGRPRPTLAAGEHRLLLPARGTRRGEHQVRLVVGAGTPRSPSRTPNMASSNGITVSGWRWISPRTLEVDISTAKVAPVAVNGPHRVPP